MKEITNKFRRKTWSRLANELLNPVGSEEDTANDPLPYRHSFQQGTRRRATATETSFFAGFPEPPLRQLASWRTS